nr:hypothetical protein [Tanacetum cinerariifolium]
MHNNIMAAGSRDRPPMLYTGQYAQSRPHFLRYIDTRPNGDALRKCNLEGPYTLSIVVVLAIPKIENSPAVPEHTTLMKCGKLLKGYNKVNPSTFRMSRLTYFGSLVNSPLMMEKQWSRITQDFTSWFVTIVKQQHKLDEVSYHKLFDILKQYQKEVNELRAKRIARNANPLAPVASAQPNQDPYYQTSKSHKLYAPTSKASLPTRSHATTRNKGKEIAKPITPPSESASEEDNDPKQAQRDKDMQKNLALIIKYFKKIYKPTNNNLRTFSNSKNKNVETIPSPVVQQTGIQCLNCKDFSHFAKECRKPKRVKDSTYHKEKLLLCKQAEKAHYSYMAKIQDVPTADSGTDSEPLEQTIQTIHMLAPKGPTFNGRPTFANLMYLKKAQSEIPCLYAIPNDQSDPVNRFVPDKEETLTLERERRSKLNKDLLRPYDYAKLNSIYEKFKPPTQEYQIQLAHANEIRKKMWQKSFVKTKPNIFKNIDFLPVSKLIRKSRQAYNFMTNNINHLKEIVDQDWVKHSKDHFCAPTACDIEIMVKTCLMPLSLNTQNDSFIFVHEFKQEMHADLKYVESLKKEIDELESDKAKFSNMYDTLLQECVYIDVICSYLHSLSDLDAHTELQCLYLHKSKNVTVLHKSFRNKPNLPQLRSTQMKDKVMPNNSQVKDKKTEVEDHPRISSISNNTKSVTACNDILKSKTSNVNAVCGTCGKCFVDSDHFVCVTEMLNDVNASTKNPNVVPISTRKPKGHAKKFVATPPKKTVALKSTTQKSKSYYRMLYEKTSKAWKWWIEQQCPT